jgi:predicted dehydrogenase
VADRGAITVGLVGLGTIAETHLAVLAGLPEVELGFVVDPDPAARDLGFGDHPPARYGRLDAALAHHRPDLVVITAPTVTHADLARQALLGSEARVLVEKPLVHDLAALDGLRSLGPGVDLDARLLVAHHFAFSPEVGWAADQLAAHPEWGPVTRMVSAFHDPYVADAEHAAAARSSAWLDSGSNQLSLLTRFVDPTGRGPLHETAGGASCWCTVTFRSGGATGSALLRASWEAVASSKRTTLHLDRSDTEIWLDHTAVTGFVARRGELVDELVNDGRTPRKLAHYRPLYRSLLSDRPDPVLGFATAAALLGLLHG